MRRFLCATVATILTLGCGAKESGRSAAGAGVAAPARVETPFSIIATDAGFIAPASVPAGLRHIVLENRGTQIHEAMLVKLPDGMTPEAYVASVKMGNDFPPGGLDYSGPGLISPGERTELWVPVDPGRYILICWNNHVTSTSVHPFTVRSDRVDDAIPPADVVLRLVDYRFELEGKLESGTRVIRVETGGPSLHEADLFLLLDGKTPDDVRRWRKTGRGPAPARALGGVDDSSNLRHVIWMRRAFPPGRYVFHCGMPLNIAQPSGGTTHADLGMIREVDVAAPQRD